MKLVSPVLFLTLLAFNDFTLYFVIPTLGSALILLQQATSYREQQRWKTEGRSAPHELHVVLEVEYTGLRKMALPMRPRVSVLDSALRNGNFSLRINPVRRDDAGLYEAQVTYNTEIRSCQVELGVVTVTLSPPRPVIENEPLLLSCNSSHQASLVETCWFHNAHPVLTSGAFCSLHGTLCILRPTVSDSGSWHCQLRYADNEVISATYNLQILGFDGPTNPVIYAAAGSAADLPCTLNYLPSAFGIHVVKTHWSHFAGGHLQNWSVPQNQSGRHFPLHLATVGPGDAGRYSCAITVGNKMLSRDMTLAVITGAQVSSPPTIFSGQVTFGLMLTLFFLLMVCVLALGLQKRVRLPASFPALERMVAVTVPKEMEENQKETTQQTEC
ncbi:UNVERIFIED_CONTAM: hypothetical protein H355_014688 [Colinus virginianus]|nr:hypothetical protein H355_014688 [Colinus virginianus]